MSGWAIGLAERGWLPDRALRFGIRRLLRERLRSERQRARSGYDILPLLCSGAVAVEADEANRQHYEVPARFFELVLGAHLKYSCALWNAETRDLDEAEATMLDLTCRRAGIENGMGILDLGCGWGSLSLWIAERFPAAEVLAVSNSMAQRRHIEARAQAKGLRNLRVQTSDINELGAVEPTQRPFDRPFKQPFDRVVSIEMFEHMRNYEALLDRISSWLAPDGRLFVHHFCHHELAYLFETDHRSDWMARHFFSGGLMPSFDLLERFDHRFALEQAWRIDRQHYQRTAEAWLERLDANREAVARVFAPVYENVERWIERWRLFFLACAELFGAAGGGEWYVGHYLLRPRAARASESAQIEGERPQNGVAT